MLAIIVFLSEPIRPWMQSGPSMTVAEIILPLKNDTFVSIEDEKVSPNTERIQLVLFLDAVKMQAACHFNQLCLKVESLKLIKNSRGPSNLQQIEKLFGYA